MKRINTLFVCLLFCVSAVSKGEGSLVREKKPLYVYWQETGFGTQDLVSKSRRHLLGVENCYLHVLAFQSCFQALHSVVDTVNSGFLEEEFADEEHADEKHAKDLFYYELVTKETFRSPFFQVHFPNHKILFELGSFFVVKLPFFPSKEIKKMVKLSQDLRVRENLILDDLFRGTQVHNVLDGDHRIQFAQMYLDLLLKLNIDPKYEAMCAGNAYSSYQKSITNDPHAAVEPYAMIRDQKQNPDLEYAGIGVELTSKTGLVFISGIKDGGSAASSKLKVMDQILSVNGKTVKNVIQAAQWIKGPQGTQVNLELLREGRKFKVTAVRRTVKSLNVEYRPMERKGKTWGYIRIHSFSDDRLCQSMRTAVKDLVLQSVHGWVLDLRANPGGLLYKTLCVGGLFLGKRVVFMEQGLSSEQIKPPELPEMEAMSELPMVILIDHRSASASEITAGAFQDHQRAWIVGTRSYGKGTIQDITPMYKYNANLSFRRTKARFLLPSGRTNQIWGIIPDFEVREVLNVTRSDRDRDGGGDGDKDKTRDGSSNGLDALGGGSLAEDEALREGDDYPNAVPPLGTAWVQTRPETVRQVDRCAQSFDLATGRYKITLESQSAKDYPLYMAQEILACTEQYKH